MICSACGKKAQGPTHEADPTGDKTLPKGWASKFYTYQRSVYGCSPACLIKAKEAAAFLVSIDPGVHSCAVVAWLGPTSGPTPSGATLYRGALTTPCGASETPLKVLELLEGWGFAGAPVCVEVPVKYSTRRSTHKDITTLAAVVAGIRSAYPPERTIVVDHHGTVSRSIEAALELIDPGAAATEKATESVTPARFSTLSQRLSLPYPSSFE